MTKEEVLHFKLILAVLALRFFGFGYFGIRHLPYDCISFFSVGDAHPTHS